MWFYLFIFINDDLNIVWLVIYCLLNLKGTAIDYINSDLSYFVM